MLFQNTENNYHDAVSIKNPEVVQKVCQLLKVSGNENNCLMLCTSVNVFV